MRVVYLSAKAMALGTLRRAIEILGLAEADDIMRGPVLDYNGRIVIDEYPADVKPMRHWHREKVESWRGKRPPRTDGVRIKAPKSHLRR